MKEQIVRKIKTVVTGSVLALGLMATATMAPACNSQLTCFADAPATCTALPHGRFTIDASAGGDAGVYDTGQPGGQLIGNAHNLSFHFSGTGAIPGAPRFSIPISTTGAGPSSVTAWYAFVDIVTCNNGSITSGVLDVINDPTCNIYADTETFPNWAAFVAAHPTYAIANDAFTFIISDTPPGVYTVSDVHIFDNVRGCECDHKGRHDIHDRHDGHDRDDHHNGHGHDRDNHHDHH